MNIQEQITTLIEGNYQDARPFEVVANEILDLGIVRLTYDAYKDEMSFYTEDKFIHSLVRKDILEAKKNSNWQAGKTLDVAKLETAIKLLDEGKVSVPEFHQQIFAAGVTSCNVYLSLQKIYYLSQDGKYYLESY